MNASFEKSEPAALTAAKMLAGHWRDGLHLDELPAACRPATPAEIDLSRNGMRVAECEIVFRFGHTLAPRAQAYTRAEVLAAVQSLHPGIEAPDSRFRHFERAGQAQLPERVNDFATPGNDNLVCDGRVHWSAFSPQAVG